MLGGLCIVQSLLAYTPGIRAGLIIGGSKAELLKISRKADRIAPSPLLGADAPQPHFEKDLGLSTVWSRDEFRHGLLLFLIVKSELLCISGKIYIAVIHIHIAVNTAYRTFPRILPQEVCAVIVGLINIDICNPHWIL